VPKGSNNTIFDYEDTSAHSGFDFLSHDYSGKMAEQ
jgi:hypothetical protein